MTWQAYPVLGEPRGMTRSMSRRTGPDSVNADTCDPRLAPRRIDQILFKPPVPHLVIWCRHRAGRDTGDTTICPFFSGPRAALGKALPISWPGAQPTLSTSPQWPAPVPCLRSSRERR